MKEVNKRVVIIGSGLGGLACGVILAKNGYQVAVLEQGSQIGGCLQCFNRGKAKFETGMHIIGSASEGQTLDRLLQYLEVKKDLTLSQLDPTGYDIVSLGGRHFRFANGREAFIRQMADYFPHQRQALERYCDCVQEVAEISSPRSLKYADTVADFKTDLMLRSINEVVDEVITDPLLAKVLVGNLPLYAAERDKTPFSTHAFVMDFYNQSTYRVVGGSDQIATSLANTIRRYGGEVLSRRKVKHIICDDSHATGVEFTDGHSQTVPSDVIPADVVISDTHPVRTLEMLDSHLIRPAFRQRINAMPQTTGIFSVYLPFKDQTVPYMNSNFFGYTGDTPWGCENYDDQSWPKGYLYMHLCHQPKPAYAQTGVILSYMQMKDVEQWRGTTIGRRGADYEAFKQERAERLLDAVEKEFPGLRSQLQAYYTSTPLTYLDYTGTAQGSMYGVAKDVTMGAACRVPHRTRVPNVLQTGQNINSHGILGVIVGAMVTCGELLTSRTIYEEVSGKR